MIRFKRVDCEHTCCSGIIYTHTVALTTVSNHFGFNVAAGAASYVSARCWRGQCLPFKHTHTCTRAWRGERKLAQRIVIAFDPEGKQRERERKKCAPYRCVRCSVRIGRCKRKIPLISIASPIVRLKIDLALTTDSCESALADGPADSTVASLVMCFTLNIFFGAFYVDLIH